MPLFPSEEWVKEFCRKINENRSYEEAARDWEGDFLFVILPDEGLKEEFLAYLDLYHGKCREYKIPKSRDEVKAEFVYEGKYSDWKRLVKGELDPIKGLLTRKFRLKGNLAKIMRYTRAAKELVSTASKVPSEFL